MAQHDFDLANQNGPSFRADLNNLIIALITKNSGASVPPVTYPGMWWVDTNTDTLKIRNDADNGWISVLDLATGLPVGLCEWLTSVTGTNTISASASASVAAYKAGQVFNFIAAGANTGAVTVNINGLGAKNLLKSGTLALDAGDIAANQVITIIYDGTQFQIASGSGGGGAKAGGVIYENGQTISSNYTISTGKNGHSVGPITVANGVTVSVPDGSRWLVS